MPKTLEVYAKESAALGRAFEAAAPQLKDAQQVRARHDQALSEAAQGLAQRVSALRAAGRGPETFKTDAEVQRWQGALLERVAQAEADRQRIQRLVMGGWNPALKGAATLEKELAADILARQKLPAAKTSAGQKALADLLKLQVEARKKLAPRRVALLAARKALLFVDDPLYFQKLREQALAPVLSPAPKAAGKPTVAKTASGAAPSKPASGAAAKSVVQPPAPKTVGPSAAAPVSSRPSSPTASRASAPAATPGPADHTLTAAAFQVAGRQARRLVSGIRQNVVAARRAARARKGRQVGPARASAQSRLRSLETIVKHYEQARDEVGEAALMRLRNGPQLVRGINALMAVRARARTMVQSLSGLR